MSDLAPEEVNVLKVTELKEHLQQRGLSTKGLKGELAARLMEVILSPLSYGQHVSAALSAQKSDHSSNSAPTDAPIAPPSNLLDTPEEKPQQPLVVASENSA